MIETTNRPFPEVFADLRPSPGVTFRPLAEHTRRLNPHAIKLVGVALDDLGRPECFVEYRAAQLRQALDRQSGDSS
jgi:hypothetical protein